MSAIAGKADNICSRIGTLWATWCSGRDGHHPDNEFATRFVPSRLLLELHGQQWQLPQTFQEPVVYNHKLSRTAPRPTASQKQILHFLIDTEEIVEDEALPHYL
jgi:hypothetical protein